MVLQAITPTLMISVMSFMAESHIDLQHNMSMEFYSHNDAFLMENFIKQGATQQEISSLIQCCLFLRVYQLSDISTGCGSRILERMHNGDDPESNMMDQWPTQPRPPKEAWIIWKKCLRFMVTSQTTISLVIPLWAWNVQLSHTFWQHHIATGRLCHQHTEGATEYWRIRGSSRQSRNRGLFWAGEVTQAPTDTTDTSIWCKHDTIYISENRTQISLQHPSQYGIFDQYLQSQHQYSWIFRHTSCYTSFPDPAKAIIDRSYIAILDGSHKELWGTASWRIMPERT
jgi:hypothetical protein